MEKAKTNSKGFIRFVKGLKSFFFEVLIVVIAVMFSFLLNEWRLEQGEREEEREILSQVLEDLKADTAKISLNNKRVKELSGLTMQLLEVQEDSIDADFDKWYLRARSVITYVPFQPSKAGYFELTTQGNANKIKNKSLLMHIMQLYESNYVQLIQINDAHKDFLIDKLNGYATTNFPHIMSAEDLNSESKHAKFKEAIFDDEFKHLLEFDYILKQNIFVSHEQVLHEQDSLIKAITPLVN